MKKWRFLPLITTLLMLSLLVGSISPISVSAQEGTSEATSEATVEPTDEPTAEPTDEPTAEPTDEPTAEPTDEATAEPTDEATAEPTDEPTAEPTDEATAEPTDEATAEPTTQPTIEPTTEITTTPVVTVTTEPVAAAGIEALAATGFNSSVQLQNLEGSSASVQILAINKAGTTIANISDTVPANGSRTYFPLGNAPTNPTQPGFGLAGSFDGSVVVQSDRQVAAISNVLATSGTGVSVGASYGSASAGATTVNLPLIMKNNGGFSTQFNVQSTNTSGDVTVTVTYTPNGAGLGNTGCTQTGTIKPGAARTFNQESDAAATFTGCTGGLLGGGNTRFVGSARIVATGGSVVATALEVGPTTLFAYSGFAGGSPNVIMPLINQNNSGFRTGVGIQNLGNQATSVTVSYTPASAGSACTETKTIAVGGSTNFAFNAFVATEAGENCANGAKFVGSARISANSTNQPLAAIVNQLNTATNKGGAYGGFNPAQASNTVNLPLIMDNNGTPKFFTGYSIANVGNSATNITCTYSLAKNGANTPPPVTANSIASGSAFSRNDNGQLRLNSSTPYVGSARCVASGGSQNLIVGIVNELAAISNGDQFLVYEGFNSN